MNLAHIVVVGLAGGSGALARFAIDGTIRACVASRVPVGTVAVNLTGSLILGVLTGLVMFHAAPSALSLVAGTGFCGGYTTFSTSSFETVRLLQEGARSAAFLNGGVTVVGALAAAALGLALTAL